MKGMKGMKCLENANENVNESYVSAQMFNSKMADAGSGRNTQMFGLKQIQNVLLIR